MVVWNGTDDVHQPGYATVSVFLADLRPYLIQGYRLAGIISFYQLRRYPRGHSQKDFRLRRAYNMLTNWLSGNKPPDVTFSFLLLGHNEDLRWKLPSSLDHFPLPLPRSVEMESVVLETNMGEIRLEIYWDHAPKVCLIQFFQLVNRAKPCKEPDLQELC